MGRRCRGGRRSRGAGIVAAVICTMSFDLNLSSASQAVRGSRSAFE